MCVCVCVLEWAEWNYVSSGNLFKIQSYYFPNFIKAHEYETENQQATKLAVRSYTYNIFNLLLMKNVLTFIT
jgi:hypothetical protein